MDKRRLKKISIFGFKSFADDTEVTFSEGVTGIVGPNGCGKSNISEAFLWVLGEQSARTLRASSMQEVIFAGSATRKPLHLAEVTISFSNTDNFLPTPYEEVAVTRKLYRDGESAYLLNNTPVRLKDIHALFMHSGVSKEAFAIIGQGKVEEIIRQSPEERRASFEEASEILHFLQERTKAKSKLQLSETELQRVHDVYQEIEKQLHHLEKQARDALKFKNIQLEFIELEKTLFWKRSLELTVHEEKLLENIQSYEASHAKIVQSIEQCEQNLSTQKEHSKEIIHALDCEKELYQTLRHKKETHLQDIGQYRERKALLQKKIQRCLEDATKYATYKKDLCSAQAEADISITQSKQSIEEAKGAYQIKLLEFQEFEKASEAVILTQKELGQKRFTQQTHVHQTESQLKKLELECLLFKEKVTQKQRAAQEADKGLRLDEEEEQEKRMSHANTLEETTRQKETIESLKKELFIVETEHKEGLVALEQLKKEFLEESTQYRILNELKENFSGFTQGARFLLADAKKSDSVLHNKIRPLAELLIGLSQEVLLLERFYTSTLVVQTSQDLELVIDVAQKNRVQDFSAIILETLLPSCTFENAPDLLHKHFLSCYQAVSSNAFIDHYKVFFWGTAKESGLFVREKKLQSHKAKAADLAQAIKERESALAILNERRTPLLHALRTQEDAVRKGEFILAELHKALQKMALLKETKRVEKEKLSEEIHSLSSLLLSKEAKIEQERQQHVDLLHAFTQSEATFQKCEEEMNAALLKLKTLQSEKEQLFAKQNIIRAHLQKEEHNHEILKLKEKEQEAQAQRNAQEHNDAVAEDKTLQEQVAVSTCELEKIDRTVAEFESKIADIRHSLAEVEKELASQEAELKKGREEKEAIATKKAHYESDLSHVQQQRTALDLECIERYATESSSLIITEEHQKLELPQLEQKCKRLKNTLEANKQINFAAEQEYEEVCKRKQFLEEQFADLKASKEELLLLIERLEVDARKVFQEKFTLIREAFQKNFSILFNGGDASLELEKDKDILDAGIEIFAKPPGKQMRSLALLSGGEKCLTTIALLFALFEARPAPFCILDEVDAPLDEINVGRFGKLLKSFAERCQFLVITHNKQTMAIADVLVGVSMQEKGVSQLVSLDFKKLSQKEPATTTIGPIAVS